MYNAICENDGRYSVCTVLESTDIDAMSDEQLDEAFMSWTRQSAHNDDYDVEINVRMCKQHIEMRKFTDAQLDDELTKSHASVARWSKKFDEEDGWLAHRIVRDAEFEIVNLEREIVRRKSAQPAAA